MTALRDLQRVFADAVRGHGSPEALERRLRGGSGRARDRVAVYADAYVSRLCDVLLDDYPKVAVVLGDRFATTVRDYVARHPSDHPSLRHFGRRFPEFLGGASLADAPWLADLARLEWARIEAFDAADDPALSFEDVQSLPEDAWPDLRLEFVPSFRSLELAWNIAEVWLALDEGRSPPRIESELTFVAVWRKGFEVRHRCCAPPEARAIARLDALEPFSAICDAFADASCAGVDDAAGRAFGALRQWLADGWVAARPTASGSEHARA